MEEEEVTIIWFTRSLPSAIAEELERQGHELFESLSISETLALAERYSQATVIINYDVEPEAAQIVQQHHPTLTMKANATAKDILWELVLKNSNAPISEQ